MSTRSPNLTQKSSNSSYSKTSEDNNYRPSVPMFVYRQLVEELQKTQFNLETITAQNQALVAQNEALKKEVSLIFNSVQNLQDIIEKKNSIGQFKTTSELRKKINNFQVKTPPHSSSLKLPREKSLKSEKKAPTRKPYLQKHILEVDPHIPNSEEDSQKGGEIKGLWLMILIIFLFLSCFVGSFFVAKSFLNDNNNSR